MSLKEKLLSSFIAFEDHAVAVPAIRAIRNEAMKTFENQGFPGRKDEAWKYTSLSGVLKEDYSILPKGERQLELNDVRKYFIYDIDTYKIVLIDGVYSSFLSQTTHDNYDICVMASAMSKSRFKPVIENYFNKIARPDSFTSLNTAFVREGAFIYIPKHTEVLKPVEIVNIATGIEPAMMLQPRNLIVAEENAHIQIIERHISLTENAVLTNSVTEIFAGNNATVDYYKLQNDNHHASLIDNTYIDQKRGSEVSVHTFAFGGKLIRNNLNFFQNGERCNSILKGITIIEGEQHVDHSTLVNHIEPNCESHQDYKGIFAYKSTGVFNGKIIVEKEAQKTDAFQQNNNIIMDDTASVNTKPQLEIFADDVKCSHGCTVGQLDEEALFYLQSRGIAKKEARALLMYAFAGNVLSSVKIPELKRRVTKLIAKKLGVNLGFEL